MTDLSFLLPKEKPLVIDLVRETGIDVSDWSNFAGTDPSVNRRYCYNWSFVKPGEFVVALLWHEDLSVEGDNIIHDQNIRLRDGRMGGRGANVWKRRATAFDESMQDAYRFGLPVRAIILAGSKRDNLDSEAKASKVAKRLLDPMPWAVVRYDFSTGDCLFVRGALHLNDVPDIDYEQERRVTMLDR